MATYSWRRHWSPHHCQNQNGSIHSWGCLLWKESPPGNKVEKVMKKEKSPITANTSFKEMKPGGKEQDTTVLSSLEIMSGHDTTKMEFLPLWSTGHIHQAPSHNRDFHIPSPGWSWMHGDTWEPQPATKGHETELHAERGLPTWSGWKSAETGGRREKREEQRRISVLEFPLLTLSVAIRTQQQIILTIKFRPRHLEGTPQIPRKPKISNTRAGCKSCIFYSVLCVRNCSWWGSNGVENTLPSNPSAEMESQEGNI